MDGAAISVTQTISEWRAGSCYWVVTAVCYMADQFACVREVALLAKGRYLNVQII